MSMSMSVFIFLYKPRLCAVSAIYVSIQLPKGPSILYGFQSVRFHRQFNAYTRSILIVLRLLWRSVTIIYGHY